jgi:hypothetical protein
MQPRPPTDERLVTFFKALSFRIPDVPPEALLSTLVGALAQPLPEDDRALLRMASLTASYVRAVREVRAGEVELDVREEAILDAALEYLREKR